MKNAQELHKEFVRLGSMRHKLKNQMLAILPDIYESKIYKKYAATIVEYAGKYGDIAKTTVIKRLRLEENLKDKPCLKAAIKEVGVHKVAMLAKIATGETDEAFADKALHMSRTAVQALSKELHAEQLGCFDFEENFKPCRAVPRTAKVELDEEATYLLMKLKEKLGKQMSDKEFIKLVLRERVEQEFAQKQDSNKNSKSFTGDRIDKKRKHFMSCEDTAISTNQKSNTPTAKSKNEDSSSNPQKPSRYIPALQKRQAIKQANDRCTYPGCNNPIQIFHHPDRYSKTKNHDNLAPVCKIHHEFAHNGLIENETQTSANWQLKTSTKPRLEADLLYRKYRQEALVAHAGGGAMGSVVGLDNAGIQPGGSGVKSGFE